MARETRKVVRLKADQPHWYRWCYIYKVLARALGSD